jgi:hypothetical protein
VQIPSSGSASSGQARRYDGRKRSGRHMRSSMCSACLRLSINWVNGHRRERRQVPIGPQPSLRGPRLGGAEGVFRLTSGRALRHRKSPAALERSGHGPAENGQTADQSEA